MANALLKDDCSTSVGLDIRDALAAAIQRSMDVEPPETSILDYISTSEWKEMDERVSDISVYQKDFA